MGSQASNTSYPVACVVIGAGSSGGGGIPKSPSFHSSLELAEATGRQIVSPENCNYFTFASPAEMNNSSDENPTAGNGFVAKTIQNFSRFQNNVTNNQSVDNENNDTSSNSLTRSSLVGSVSNSIANRINSINDKLNNGTNNLVKMPQQQQQQQNISTNGDNKNLLRPVAVAVVSGGSPSRARDRNNLNGGVSPNSTVNGSIPLPLIKGFF
ncbi:uncharacterized protein DDB_G0288805-like [Culicoides brevitarsis]|uniref:uncharacterized protein DDB_G0288805-like n=1 Tax=Culicoides brevitarsis TaxID=469753 RepID=UPI00307B7502